jgi:hypothetical protein
MSSVCNACQLAKSHQLPYNNSIHRSTSPIELIFFDVWGPAPTFVGGFKYYISFIDDFSKFTWIYLMNDRTNAQHIYMLFQAHVERLLDTKIKCVQSDWVGNIKNFTINFSSNLALPIVSLILMATNKMVRPNESIGILWKLVLLF